MLEADDSKRRKKRNRKERRSRLPDNLPVIETIIQREQVKACPEAWRRIGEEISELLDHIPPRFQRLRTVRPKYVRIADREAPPIIVPLPPKLIEGGIASAGLIMQIVISKYCDHLPLYRQEKIYRQRHGIRLPRQTMCNWVEQTAEWLKPFYQEMRRQLFDDGYVGIDEPSGARQLASL